MNKYIKIIFGILGLSLLFSFHIYSQDQKTVVVRDESGSPVVGATVIIGEDGKPVLTNDRGEFTISLRGRIAILVEAEGFDSQILNYEPGVVLDNITLVKPPFHLGEKDRVDVPFGSVQKRKITGGVYTLNPSDILLYDYVGSVNSVLSGRVPGLYGSNNIRGIGTPLYVIDGVARPTATMLNIHEISQVSVLKDMSTAMLYGSQATNGVIYITTKRGAPLRRGLQFTGERGISTPVRFPKYLSSADYMELFNEALDNDGLSPRYTPSQISATRSGTDGIRYPDEDYYNDRYLKDWSGYHNINAEVSGGNDIAQFFLNLGWSRSNSLLKIGEGGKEKSDVLSMRGNIDYEITDDIKLTFDGTVRFEISKLPRYTGSDFWTLTTQLRPDIYPVLIPLDLIKDPTMSLAARPISGGYVFGGTSEYQTNIYGELTKNGSQGYTDRLMGIRTGLDFDLGNVTPGLTASVYFSFDMFNQYREEILNSYAVYNPIYSGDTINRFNKFKSDVNVASKTVGDAYFYRGYGVTGTLDYHRVFGLHDITATALAYGDDYTVESILQSLRHLHGGIRFNYMYDNKYVVQLTGVRAGSMKLYDGQRWASSPGIGLGWILTEEDFMSDNSIFNYLKLRGNWALLQTDENMGYTLDTEKFTTAGSISSSNIRSFLSSFRLDKDYYTSGSTMYWYHSTNYSNVGYNIFYGNPDLGWEKIMNTSFGFESMLLNSKLWAELSYFYNKYYDIAVQRVNTLPNYFGNVPYENYGSNQTQGFEAGLQYTDIFGDLSLSLGANFLYSVPKVLVLDELAYDEEYLRRTGKAGDAMYGLIALGLFRDQADIDNSVYQDFGPVRPGDIKYKDLNNDGKIDDSDVTVIGNSRARFDYGLNLRLQYNSFEFFALGRGQVGQERNFTNTYYWVYGDRKYSEVVWDRWTPETASTATYPRLSSGSNSNNFRNSTFWNYSTNWFTFNTAQLTYILSSPGFAGLDEVRFFLRGSNLGMISKEKDKLQLNVASRPQMRSFSLGINMIF